MPEIKRLFFVLISLTLLVFFGCSSIEQQRNYIPVELNIIQRINIDFIPQKCVYSSSDRTAFISEKNLNNIHIFKYGKRINTIGGLGFENTNFHKLSDITLAPDGKLLALDSFQKKIKKIDVDGQWITDLNLDLFSKPTLFDISTEETFYIYDDNRKEIVITKTFHEDDFYSFGKFQLIQPEKLVLTKNSLVIYDTACDKTFVYDKLGQFRKELNGYIQFDKNQEYKLETHYLLHYSSGQKFAISTNTWNDFFIERNYVMLLSDNEVWIAEFTYEIR